MRQEAPAEKPKLAPQPERKRKTESADARELRDAAPPPELQKAPEPAPHRPHPPPRLRRLHRLQHRMRFGVHRNRPGLRQCLHRRPPRPLGALRQRTPSFGGRMRAAARIASASATQSPEQWLQGIADLRRQARHDEADKALAEFRKRYPDYRISKEMRKAIERNGAR